MNEQKMSIHAGEHLSEFLDEYGIAPSRLASDTCLPVASVNEILAGKQPITPDTAMRLGRYFGTSAELWINLQINYEMELAKRDKQAQIEHDITPLATIG